MIMDLRQLERWFTYHRPDAGNDQPARYEAIRAAGLSMARLVDELMDDCREKSLAITSLRQAVMWANAGIAVNE
jgi:hypothetical protein